MVSRQPKAIGTRKSREADDGQAPEGVELILRLRDPAKYGCQVGDGEGERAIRRRRCRPLEHQATPGYEGINAATSLLENRKAQVLDYPSQETQRGVFILAEKRKAQYKLK